MMREVYWPLILVAILAFGFGIGTIVISKLVGPKRPDPSKLSPYECGVEPVGDARKPFFIHYYMIALLFLVFDIEVIFLYPWALKFKEMGSFAFWEMAVFIVIFLGIFLYAYVKGVLEWE
ncbi:MAG: NADH-quinone oxidoreductase subunit A [Thermosulfidibacteraceae bacterium]